MNREEILAKGRADNKNNDPIEIEVSRRAVLVGTVTGVSLCMILFFAKLLIIKQVDLGLWSLIFASTGAEMMYQGKKLGKKKTFFVGIVCSVLAAVACFICIYMMISGGR